MEIRGSLVVTVSSDFLKNSVYSHIKPLSTHNIHRDRSKLIQCGVAIAEHIEKTTGGEVRATPSIRKITASIFLLRINVVISEKASLHSKIVSDDICGYFSYILNVDRSLLSFRISSQSKTFEDI